MYLPEDLHKQTLGHTEKTKQRKEMVLLQPNTNFDAHPFMQGKNLKKVKLMNLKLKKGMYLRLVVLHILRRRMDMQTCIRTCYNVVTGTSKNVS